jgi:hypothetical protein
MRRKDGKVENIKVKVEELLDCEKMMIVKS